MELIRNKQMKKINIKDLSSKYGIINGYSVHSNTHLAAENFNNFCKDFAQQILTLAAEKVHNSTCDLEYSSENEELQQSILDIINQIE